MTAAGSTFQTYELLGDPPAAIHCRVCGSTSQHPSDILERYCGCCHRFHETLGVAFAQVATACRLLDPEMPEADQVRIVALLLAAIEVRAGERTAGDAPVSGPRETRR